MGSRDDERPFGLLHGFAGEDSEGEAAEERERAEGMQAPPTSVLVPRLSGGGLVEPAAVEYPLIGFPWEPWTLTARLTLTAAQAGAWADWLSEAEAGRLAVIASVLGQAGAPVGAVREQSGELPALGAWIQRWFGVVAEPLLGRGFAGDPGWRRGFFQDQPEVRLGSAWAPWGPSDAGYSRFGDALLHSLAVDLAFLVTDAARAVHPGLRWQAVAGEQFQDIFVTPDPGPPPFALVRQVREFLVQSLARPRGGRGRELRQWRSRALYGCYQRAAAGIVQRPEHEEFPGYNNYRAGCRYRLERPPRTGPPPPQLADAVIAFRRAGWFDSGKLSKLTAAGLAAAAQAAWRAYEREEIPSAAVEMGWRLLVLDCGRTWSEDVDADVRPQDNLHEQTLFAIERIGGKGFGHFRDGVEDWASTPGDVELSFWWGRRHHRLRLPTPGRFLSPALITGLNGLLAAGGQRLWFFDHGPPIAIVTRATAAERDALEQLTGIRLDPDPPIWWTNLAPLPAPPEHAPPQPADAEASRPRARENEGTAAQSSSGPGNGRGQATTPDGGRSWQQALLRAVNGPSTIRNVNHYFHIYLRNRMLFTEDHEAFRQSVRGVLAREVVPHVEEWEEAEAFPAHELFKALGAAGLFGLEYDPAYGGQGADHSYTVVLGEELGRMGCAGVAMAVTVQTDMATPSLYRHGSDELKQRYLAPAMRGEMVASIAVTEPGAGSDVAGIRTRADRDGDDWVINGSKLYITNGTQADWLCLLARTSGEGGYRGMSQIIVPAGIPGYSVSRKLRKLGNNCSDTAELAFTDVRVPVPNTIGEIGRGFQQQMAQFQNERMIAAYTAVGAMDAALRRTAGYLREREVFGGPLLGKQYVQFRLAELAAEVDMLRQYNYACAEAYLRGEDTTRFATIAKLKAGRLQRQIADTCVQFHGGFGYMAETWVSRYFRDSRLLSIGGGADEVMLQILARLDGFTN